MSLETDEASIEHIKINKAELNNVIEKFFDLEAFTEKTAVLIATITLSVDEEFAFKRLIDENEILIVEKDEQKYYYLADHYKPEKSYRKYVVMGFSIPLLIFILSLILAGIIVIIYQIIKTL